MTTELKLNELRGDEANITSHLQPSDMVSMALDSLEHDRSAAIKATLEKEQLTLPFQIASVQEFYSDELWQAMEHRNLSQVEFANKAQVSKQFLTKVFHGGNCTIETIVKLAFALDYRVNIHLTPVEMCCAWLHCADGITWRQTKRFSNPWDESSYKPMVAIEKEFDLEKFSAQS